MSQLQCRQPAWTLSAGQGHRPPPPVSVSLSLGHSVSSVTHSLRASGKPAAPGHTRLHRIDHKCTAVWPTESVEAGNCPVLVRVYTLCRPSLET